MADRAEIENFIIENIRAITPGDDRNADNLKDLISQMSDAQFDNWLDRLESGKEVIPLVLPNMSRAKAQIKNMFDIADKIGHDFFQKLWMQEAPDTPMMLTNERYMVLTLPVCRQAQVLDKKIAVPDHNNTVDHMTGQATGASKGAKISNPELQILSAAGLVNSAIEFMKLRGGDETAFRALNASISKTGGASLEAISKLDTTPKVNQTLHVLFAGMHIGTTLLKRN